MSDAEVKVRVGVEDDNTEVLERMRDKLKDLRREQKELENMGAPKEARVVERRANSLERRIDREGARLLRVEDDDAQRAAKAPLEEQRQTIAKALTEEAHARAAGNHAAADAMRRETDLMQRALTLQRTKGVSQADALEIAKQEAALKNAGISTPAVAGGGGLGSILQKLGAGAMLTSVLDTTLDHYAAVETLSNRRVSTQARDRRQSAIIAQRGTSGEAAAASWAAEDRAAALEQERPQLESDRKHGVWSEALKGAAMWGGIGAGVGMATGPGALVTGGIGALAGAATHGIRAWMSGTHKLDQNAQDKEQAEADAQEKDELARKKFMAEEGGLQLDALRQRSKQTMAGQREAFADDMAQQWIQTYRDVYARSKDKDIANEMADLTVKGSIRDRQATAGAGLVDAYTGAGGIAAAASWAQQTGGWEEVASKIDGLRSSVDAGNQNAQTENQGK